jgi:hypothetical protein
MFANIEEMADSLPHQIEMGKKEGSEAIAVNA